MAQSLLFGSVQRCVSLLAPLFGALHCHSVSVCCVACVLLRCCGRRVPSVCGNSRASGGSSRSTIVSAVGRQHLITEHTHARTHRPTLAPSVSPRCVCLCFCACHTTCAFCIYKLCHQFLTSLQHWNMPGTVSGPHLAPSTASAGNNMMIASTVLAPIGINPSN